MWEGIATGLGTAFQPANLAWVVAGCFAGTFIGMMPGLALNLPLIPYLSRIIYLRRRVLVPCVIAFSLLGVYLTSLNAFDVYLMRAFALAGLALRLAGFPLAPLLLGFILSGMLEENLRRTILLADGSLGLILERPVSIVLLVLCATIWAAPLMRVIRERRNRKRNHSAA